MQPRDLQSLIEERPPLRPFAERVVPQAFVNGSQAAERETGPPHVSNDVCPWALNQILSIDCLPD